MSREDESVLDANEAPLLAARSEQVPAEVEHPRADRSTFRDVRAVYFDLDDTLCAYWDASKTGLRRAFELHGPEGFSPEESVKAWAATFREFAPTLKETGWYEGYLLEGEPTRTEQMRRTLHRLGVPDHGRAVLLSETYFLERDRALVLFKDALAILNALSPHYPLGLITNGPADVQRSEIATLGIAPFFRNIFIEGEMGEGKPKPSVFRRAAQAVGCDPHEIVMVGNSYRHDVQAALEAGWRAIWVRRPTDVPPSAGEHESMPEGLPEGGPVPDAVVNELDALATLLLDGS